MADEILKAKLQQISDNDEQIGTDSLEIKGQVNALRQYGIGVTGIQRDRLGDVVYDLADGYGGGGGGLPPEIVSVNEYIHQEDWLSDANGNTLNFAKTYLGYDEAKTTFRVAFIYGNTARTYRAGCFWIYPTSTNGTTSGGGGTFATTYSNRNLSSTASFWVSAGSRIVVVELRSIFTGL